MNETQQYTIKALTGFRKMPPPNLLVDSTAIALALDGNSNYTPPSLYDVATLKAANSVLATSITASVNGGSQAIAQRNHDKEVVVKLLEQLAKFVEANCKNDMTIFLSSGFKPASQKKTLPAPVSESFRSVTDGPNSGQAVARPMKCPGAASYEVRYAPVPAGGGTPTAWTSQPVSSLRFAPVISGLTPGTTYAFQVRALVNSAYTDWSDSVTKMVI